MLGATGFHPLLAFLDGIVFMARSKIGPALALTRCVGSFVSCPGR
jgi:hypothetical protein